MDASNSPRPSPEVIDVPDPRTILITGATGKQGGAIAAERTGYDVDIPALERQFGIPPTRFAEWAASQRGA